VRAIDLSAVDDKTAKKLLTDFANDIRAITRHYDWLNAADQDDLKGAAALAVLEGHLTFNGVGTVQGWIRTVVRWRVREAAEATYRPELETLVANPERVNGADPEQQFWRATAVRAIGTLSLRHRAIVDGRMKGETFEEIGQSIGLTTQLTHRESKKAFTLLREVLDIEEPEKLK
jgi:DNA-directed RNA polymerase specialized sigma24 family protein